MGVASTRDNRSLPVNEPFTDFASLSSKASNVGVMSSNLKGSAGPSSSVGVMSSNLNGAADPGSNVGVMSSCKLSKPLWSQHRIQTAQVSLSYNSTQYNLKAMLGQKKKPFTSQDMENLVGRFDEIYGAEISKIWKSTLAALNDIKRMSVAASNVQGS